MGQRREGFRSYARQSVVELDEIEPATIHRLAIRRGGLTLNVRKKIGASAQTANENGVIGYNINFTEPS